MLGLGPFPPLKHDTGDKRHFVCSKNSSTDSLSWDEQQIVLMRKLTKEQSRCYFSIHVQFTTSNVTGKIRWYGHSRALFRSASFVKQVKKQISIFNLNICIFIHFQGLYVTNIYLSSLMWPNLTVINVSYWRLQNKGLVIILIQKLIKLSTGNVTLYLPSTRFRPQNN